MVTWNGLITLAATGATMMFAYLFQVLMARWLTTLEYGELSAILAALNVMTIPVFGLCMAVTRDVAAAPGGDRPQLGAILRPYAMRVASVTVAMIAGLVLFNSGLSGFLQLSTPTPLVYLAFLVVLTNLVGTGRAILIGLHDFASVALNQVVEALLRLISATGIALYGLATTGGFGGYSLGLVAALILVVVRLPMRVSARRVFVDARQDHSAQRPLPPRAGNGDISLSAIIVTGTFIVLLNMDLIVVKHFLPPELAGQYAAISTLAKALFVITNAFDVVLFPLATTAQAAGADGGAHLRQALFSIGLIVVPLLGVYWLVGTPLVSLIFGPRYAGVATLLFPYALAVTLLGLATLIARYRLAVGRGVSSAALVGTVAAAAAAFVAFHDSLGQVVAVLLVTGVASLALGLSWAIRRAPSSTATQRMGEH